MVHKFHPLALLVVFVSSFTFAQNLATLEGSVSNKLTNAPVRHAHVLYIKTASESGPPSGPLSVDTDSDGRFSLQLEPGSYRLWVEHPGYAHQAYGAHTPQGQGAIITLAAGQHLQDVNIPITPLGAIAGRVLDEEGEPLQNVAIEVLHFSYAAGRRQLVPVGGASSNDRGEYRSFGLPAGRYYLLASLRSTPLSRPVDKGSLAPELVEPYAPLYYPGVIDPDSASVITLPAGGQLTDVDFHLQRIRGVTLRGRILSPLEDFAGSQLQVVLAHDENHAASYIDRLTANVDKASGRFEFHGVAPGSYLLVASQLYHGRAFGGRTAIEVGGASQDNLAVSMVPAFDLTGNLEVEGGNGARLSGINVRLIPAENLALGAPPASKPGADGSLRIAGVTPGLWDLSLEGLPEGMWIKSATYGRQDVLSRGLHIHGNTPALLHIVLSGSGGQLSGVVAENAQPRQATLVLAPATPELQHSPLLYRTSSTREGGAFQLNGVRPGSYKLFAFEEVEPNSWLDPDFLKSVDTQGEPVEIKEGDHLSRRLTPVSPDTLAPER